MNKSNDKLPNSVKEVIESNINEQFTPLLLASPMLLEACQEAYDILGKDPRYKISDLRLKILKKAIKTATLKSFNNECDHAIEKHGKCAFCKKDVTK